MIKKIIALVGAVALIMSSQVSLAADTGTNNNNVDIVFTQIKKKSDPRPILMREFFTRYCDTIGYGIPEVYRQLTLKMTNVTREEPLYASLQKCVYLGFITNSTVTYKWDSPVTPKFINVFVAETLRADAAMNEENKYVTREEFNALVDALPNYKMLMSIGTQTKRGLDANYQSPLIESQGFSTLTQIYQLFKSEYWSGDAVTDDTLIQGAIKGMSNSIGDIHTQYFPPTDAQQFNDSLNGTFEGIGGYLDLVKPGDVVITSVIKNGPAQKAGLQTNDHIVKVDDYVITEKDSLNAIIGKIKGPAGTVVKLTINRNGTSLIVPVTRSKITIDFVTYELRQNVPVITISTFGYDVAAAWQAVLEKNAAKIQNGGKLIIDLRNNPGGSLQEVAEMLSNFVEKGQPVVVTRSRYQEETIVSEGIKTVDFSKVKIVILINSATASASEIMAGTIKDYFPKNTVIVGETSYGKGSVQYLQSFADNSSFKLTVAHWFTGKTQKAIEGVGIKPDVEVPLNLDQLKQGYDTQMEAALRQ